MPRKRQDIHLNHGTLQTVFEANHTSVYVYLSSNIYLLNICCLAQPTRNRHGQTNKAKDASMVPSVFDDAILASVDQDGISL